MGYEDKIDLKSKKPRKLFDDKTGKALNVNEAKIEFEYDDKDPVFLVVTLEVWKHLDGSFIEDIIVEPTYLRVTIKGKILQLRFLEEVYCSEERYVSIDFRILLRNAFYYLNLLDFINIKLKFYFD